MVRVLHAQLCSVWMQNCIDMIVPKNTDIWTSTLCQGLSLMLETRDDGDAKLVLSEQTDLYAQLWAL